VDVVDHDANLEAGVDGDLLEGAVSAAFTMFAPVASSPVKSTLSKAVAAAFASATPPPGSSRCWSFSRS